MGTPSTDAPLMQSPRGGECYKKKLAAANAITPSTPITATTSVVVLFRSPTDGVAPHGRLDFRSRLHLSSYASRTIRPSLTLFRRLRSADRLKRSMA
jgi:hypothetical protein